MASMLVVSWVWGLSLVFESLETKLAAMRSAPRLSELMLAYQA